jgi:hypothetical protein
VADDGSGPGIEEQGLQSTLPGLRMIPEAVDVVLEPDQRSSAGAVANGRLRRTDLTELGSLAHPVLGGAQRRDQLVQLSTLHILFHIM